MLATLLSGFYSTFLVGSGQLYNDAVNMIFSGICANDAAFSMHESARYLAAMTPPKACLLFTIVGEEMVPPKAQRSDVATDAALFMRDR